MHPAGVYGFVQGNSRPMRKLTGVGVRIGKRDQDALFERREISPEGMGKLGNDAGGNAGKIKTKSSSACWRDPLSGLILSRRDSRQLSKKDLDEEKDET